MNPLVLLGLGALAFMAMGKKKPPVVEEEYEEEEEEDEEEDTGPVAQRFVATKIQPKKTTLFVKAAPLNYQSTIAQNAGPEAKQCRLQGMGGVEQITVCIANKLFPGWSWANRSGWQNDAWVRMKDYALIELGIPTHS